MDGPFTISFPEGLQRRVALMNIFRDRGRESPLVWAPPPSEPLVIHLRLLPTPPRGDAVTIGYRPESVYLKRTSTSLA